jgi:quercetin dioxygenase-like cupin family protein
MKKKTLSILIVICLTALFTASLLPRKEQKPTVKAEVLAKSTKSWDGGTLPHYPKGQPEITIVKLTIPPKTRLPLHKHPVILGGVILEGELTVITEEKKRRNLKSGDPIVEVVNKWHYGVNEGNINTVAYVFYVGIEDQPLSINKPKSN